VSNASFSSPTTGGGPSAERQIREVDIDWLPAHVERHHAIAVVIWRRSKPAHREPRHRSVDYLDGAQLRRVDGKATRARHCRQVTIRSFDKQRIVLGMLTVLDPTEGVFEP